VNYNTSLSNYYITMDVYNDYGSCYQFDPLTWLLAGSGKNWYSSCGRVCPHVLTIKVTQACVSSSWVVMSVGFRLKGVKNTEIDIDYDKVFSVSCAVACNYL